MGAAVRVPFGAENRLLLACMTQPAEPERIRARMRPDINWALLAMNARRLHVAPLLYRALADAGEAAGVPDHISAELKRAYLTNAARNIGIYSHLAAILERFARLGIPVIVLKGAALAELVYTNRALRYISDLDLLLREEDLDPVEGLLREDGFVPVRVEHSRDWYLANHHHRPPLTLPGTRIVVELHHHITRRSQPFHLKAGELWERAPETQIAGVTTRMLAVEDLVLHVSLHLVQDNGFLGQLRGLCDLAHIVAAFPDQIDWDRLCARASRYNHGAQTALLGVVGGNGADLGRNSGSGSREPARVGDGRAVGRFHLPAHHSDRHPA